MSSHALASSDLLLRARFKAILENPAELEKFSAARQDYIAFAHAALDWWIDDQDSAGEDVPDTWAKGPHWERHHCIMLHWRGEVEDAELEDVVRSIVVNGRANLKSKKKSKAA